MEIGYGQRYANTVFGINPPDTLTVPLYGKKFLAEINFHKVFINKKPWRDRTFTISDFIGLTYRNVRDIGNFEFMQQDIIDCYAVKTKISAWAIRWGIRLAINFFVLEVYGETGIKNIERIYFNYESFDVLHYPLSLGEPSPAANTTNMVLNVGVKTGININRLLRRKWK